MNKPPLKQEAYPIYFMTDRKILAFIAPDQMYKIEQIGSNHGSKGVCIDYYITRRMVIEHWPMTHSPMDQQEFKKILTKLFGSYISKICDI